MEAGCRKALAQASALNNFLTKHLNVWVSGASPWMPMEAWRACGQSDLTPEAFAGAVVRIGVDLAEVRDIAAIVAVMADRVTTTSRNLATLLQEEVERRRGPT